MKVPVNMASPLSKAKWAKAKLAKAVPLAEFVADIDRRRAETGIAELPHNSGTRRTESKKALLAAIKDAGGNW